MGAGVLRGRQELGARAQAQRAAQRRHRARREQGRPRAASRACIKGPARARLLRFLRARLVALGSSALPGRDRPTGCLATSACSSYPPPKPPSRRAAASARPGTGRSLLRTAILTNDLLLTTGTG
eukprot:scaffold71132_cov69-Phaeocystis_antarctica.AAC.1